MFKPNDKLICIDNRGYEKYLVVGKTYDVVRIKIGNVTGKIHLVIQTDVRIIEPLEFHFTDLIGYRKLKIEKIKENICLKSVKE